MVKSPGLTKACAESKCLHDSHSGNSSPRGEGLLGTGKARMGESVKVDQLFPCRGGGGRRGEKAAERSRREGGPVKHNFLLRDPEIGVGGGGL